MIIIFRIFHIREGSWMTHRFAFVAVPIVLVPTFLHTLSPVSHSLQNYAFFFFFSFFAKGNCTIPLFFFFNLRCELINLILRDSKSNITYITKALMSYCCEYGIFVTTRTIQLLPSIMWSGTKIPTSKPTLCDGYYTHLQLSLTIIQSLNPW